MPMVDRLRKSSIDGLYEIECTRFKDHRGYYEETFNVGEMDIVADLVDRGKIKFVQDDVIFSHKDVLRGFHGDAKTWKLVTCLVGEFDIAVCDINPDSPTFMKTQGFTLNQASGVKLLIPPLVINAHLCKTDVCLFHYKQTSYWLQNNLKYQYTVQWNDPTIAVPWATTKPILSARDEHLSHSLEHYLIRNEDGNVTDIRKPPFDVDKEQGL